MLAEFSLLTLAALAALVFLGGFVDALAGGGGLVTLPAYLAAGLDPALVLGTNKLSSSIGTVASAARYLKARRLDWTQFVPAAGASLAGAFLGARLALHLDPSRLRYILLAALPPVAYAVLTARREFQVERRTLGPGQRLRRLLAVSIAVGGYDGFFGPGTGTFFALALNRFCRFDLVEATAGAKVLNLSSNLSALAAFALAGQVHAPLGSVLGLAGIAGHYAGSGLGIRRGEKVIRPVIALVCAGLFLKILFDVL